MLENCFALWYTDPMVRIWAKILKNDKIVRDTLYIRETKFDSAQFFDYLTEICHELDIPTPVVLKSHKKNFSHFNVTKFRTADFVESVPFDLLTLENAAE